MDKELLERYKKLNPVKYAQKFGHLDKVADPIPEATQEEVSPEVVADKPKRGIPKKS